MRVTELTKHNAVTQNLNNNAEELQNLMVGLSNGKKLNKPSDDPVGTARANSYKTSINQSESIKQNIDADKVWLTSNETIIMKVAETLQRIKKLALEGGNGSATPEFRESMSEEIEGIVNDMVKMGNKKEGKLYLFSGTKTFTAPLKVQPKLSEAEIKYDPSRLKSDFSLPLIDQDKMLIVPEDFIKVGETGEPDPSKLVFENLLEEPLKPGSKLKAGSISFIITKKSGSESSAEVTADSEQKTGEPTDQSSEEGTQVNETVITIQLDGSESFKEIVEKINQAAIAQQKYEKSETSPTGFKMKLRADIGIDGSLCIYPEIGSQLSLEKDSTGLFQIMNFRKADEASFSEDQYKSSFEGYSKNQYIVRITKDGSFGEAQFIISDDGGKTWSKTNYLKNKNNIFNPEGKASDKVTLLFKESGKPLFKEGTEFHFNGNEFVTYQGNEQIKNVLIDNGTKVALNITAKDIFFNNENEENKVNVFDMLNRLIESLKVDDQQAILKSISDTDKAIDQTLLIQGKIGSILKELEDSEDRIDRNIDFKGDGISKIEDMDMAKGSIDLNQAEMKHKTALDSTARLIQPTLINFLK